MRSHWIRRGLLGAYVLLTAFVLAHSVNAFVEYSLTSRRSEPVTLSPQPSGEAAQRDPNTLMRSILTSRLFPLPQDTDPNSGFKRSAPKAPPIDVAKKFLLLGTVISPNGFAILEDLSSKQQTLYRLNDAVSLVGTIAQIEKDRVLFKRNDQEEWLDRAIQTLRPGFESKLPAVLPAVVAQQFPAEAVDAPSDRRRHITRQLLVETSKDSGRLFVHARLEQLVANGRVQGIKLEAVNFYGFYGNLGLESGDVLKRLNGVELLDITRLPALVQGLTEERTFTLDILRKNAPLTLTYEVA